MIASEVVFGNTPTGDLHGYIDVAISTTNSPTQPTPGAQYYEYQFSANLQAGAGEGVCYWPTLGMDYWGLYIGCVMEDTVSGFFGNDLLAIPKAGFYSGSSSSIPYWHNIAVCPPNSCVSPPYPSAWRISPALEDGTPDAEYIVATAAGLGQPNNHALTVCALTNTAGITNATVVFTCYMDNTLPFAYSDALAARQGSSSRNLYSGQGTNQVFFRSGSLWLAFTDGGAGYDTIDWLEVRPRLTTKGTHNPQWVDAPTLLDYGNVVVDPNFDFYQPSIMPSQEGDAALIFNASGLSTYPGIVYTGRRSYDPPHTMGQGSVVALSGGVGTSAHNISWGYYNGCAMQLNSVTRGTLWCGADYQTSSTNTIWNTRLAQLRLE